MEEEILRDDDGNGVYVDPGEAARIEATLSDATGADLTTAQIATLTLTLMNSSSGAVINGRNATNIKNTGIGTVEDDAETGVALMTLRLTAADNPNVGSSVGTMEEHIALVAWTWVDDLGVTQTGKQRWRIYVKPIVTAVP